MTYPLLHATHATHASASRPRRALLTSALALSLAGGIFAGPVVASAQDGTGAATPTPPSACKIVPVSERDSATPVETPVETPDSTPTSATPVASPVVEAETPAPVDPLATDLELAATAIAGCLSDANYDTLITMTSDLYRGQLFGTSAQLDAETFAELAPMLPQVAYQILEVEDATATDETTATARITYEMAHQVRTSIWEFTQQEVSGQTAWVLASETPAAISIPSGTPSIAVEVKDNDYALSPESIDGTSVALEAKNSDEVDHELLVLRFADGTGTKDLLLTAGPTLPEGVNFIGQAIIPAGEDGTLLLAGLQPGTYTIVCLLPDENGTPHLVNGMEASFTVK